MVSQTETAVDLILTGSLTQFPGPPTGRSTKGGNCVPSWPDDSAVQSMECSPSTEIQIWMEWDFKKKHRGGY